MVYLSFKQEQQTCYKYNGLIVQIHRINGRSISLHVLYKSEFGEYLKVWTGELYENTLVEQSAVAIKLQHTHEI